MYSTVFSGLIYNCRLQNGIILLYIPIISRWTWNNYLFMLIILTSCKAIIQYDVLEFSLSIVNNTYDNIKCPELGRWLMTNSICIVSLKTHVQCSDPTVGEESTPVCSSLTSHPPLPSHPPLHCAHPNTYCYKGTYHTNTHK